MKKILFGALVLVCGLLLSTQEVLAQTDNSSSESANEFYVKLPGDYVMNAKRSDVSCVSYLVGSHYSLDTVPTLALTVGPGTASAQFELPSDDGLTPLMEVDFDQINGGAQHIDMSSPNLNKKTHVKLEAVWDFATHTLYDRYKKHKAKNLHTITRQPDGSLKYSGAIFDAEAPAESCIFEKKSPEPRGSLGLVK